MIYLQYINFIYYNILLIGLLKFLWISKIFNIQYSVVINI